MRLQTQKGMHTPAVGLENTNKLQKHERDVSSEHGIFDRVTSTKETLNECQYHWFFQSSGQKLLQCNHTADRDSFQKS